MQIRKEERKEARFSSESEGKKVRNGGESNRGTGRRKGHLPRSHPHKTRREGDGFLDPFLTLEKGLAEEESTPGEWGLLAESVL